MTGGLCGWCDLPRVVVGGAAELGVEGGGVLCPHCDIPHSSDGCETCRMMLGHGSRTQPRTGRRNPTGTHHSSQGDDA